MAAALLSLKDVHLTFGGTPLLEGAELFVGPGERIALVGRNGSGKSTLLKIASGDVEADKVERFVQPGVTVRYLPQEPDLSAYKTVLEYVEAGLAPGDEDYRAIYLLDQLGVAHDADPASLSGGEARRAALARTLAPEPDVLLLDEPTNHLDLPAIEWLQAELSSMKSAMLIISHDRRFLSDLTRSTIWLDRGVTRQTSRGFAHFEEWRDEILALEELEQHKLDRQIVREEHWVRYGVTARRKRNVRRMSELADLRQKRDDHRGPTGSVKLSVSDGRQSGAIVADIEEVSKAFGDKQIVSKFSTRIMRGDRIGIVGPNGAGKTTLIKMIIGELAPDSGKVKLGTKLEVATLDQKRAQLDPMTTLKDALTGGGGDNVVINGQARHVVGYMKDFLFLPEQANTAVGKLSGGERARVMIARSMSLPSNFLILDEPTNDLDLETLDLLQEMIADYDGTVLVVSHDREFLDRVVTSTIIADGDGVWTEYPGGYSDMVRMRGYGVTKPKGGVKTVKPKAQKTTSAAKPSAKKLSFKHKHALDTLPGEIEKLEAEIVKLQAELADPNLYAQNAEKFQKLSDQLSQIQRKLDEKEEQWLEIELLKEEIENS
ncbi:ATP-binding cassette domain-containing protein [Maritalea porphyrae]|nr:ATP-binding cassette domain-containing protein [Maritalea porphyrae]MCZ4273531.1 ATP-binding cassette domain-containing protein [Maritalea porphyrae]